MNHIHQEYIGYEDNRERDIMKKCFGRVKDLLRYAGKADMFDYVDDDYTMKYIIRVNYDIDEAIDAIVAKENDDVE